MRPAARVLLVPFILACSAPSSPAPDWPQWAGSAGKNMVSLERGLPDSFLAGEKKPDGTIDLDTARNVKWGIRIGSANYSTPSIANGKIFVGGVERENGIFVCLEAATGKLLWKWKAPAKKFPNDVDGFHIGIHEIPAQMGVCSTATIDGDRVYFVSHRFEVVCLDANGQAGTEHGEARVVWSFDMQEKTGAFPCDATDGSPLIDGDLLYVQTSNGVDRNSFSDPRKEKDRKFPAPDAPNVIVLDKRTGRLVATDNIRITDNLLHGQWSSLSLGTVGGRKLVFFGGGDGCCYAFEALTAVPEKPVRLKTIWSYDCIPAEYKAAAGEDRITHYCLGDKRVAGTLNQHDGAFVGMSEIVGTPVFVHDRIYVALGRDPEHGRGRGAMHCIDATGSGDITESGRVWSYQGLDRTISTASVADGLTYLSDVAGRLHCLDAETGKCYWIHETKSEVWGSTLVADGKVYMPTAKYLWVLKAGKTLEVLSRVNLGSRIFASPVAANGTLYVATTGGWLWAVEQRPAADKWTDFSRGALEGSTNSGVKAAWPGGCSGVVVNRLNGDVIVKLVGCGLWRSSDKGKTWQRIDGNHISGRDETGWATTVDQNAPTRMASFSLDGLAGWTLDGLSWRSFTNLGRNWDFGSVDWAPIVPTTIIAARHETNPPGEVYLTIDGGMTWKKLTIYLNESRDRISMLGALDSTTFVYSKGEGIYRSADSGLTWIKVSSANPQTRIPVLFQGIHYLGSATGLLVSKDKGASWLAQGTAVNIWQGPFFGLNAKEMLIVGNEGVFVTKNAGETWTHATGLKSREGDFDFSPNWFGCYSWDAANNILYASAMGNSVYKCELGKSGEANRE